MNTNQTFLFFFYIKSFDFFLGAEGFTTEEDQELLSRIEKQVKRRFVIGSQVSEHAIINDFTRQVTLVLLLSVGLLLKIFLKLCE